jgi:hypothetical protein
MYWERQPLGVFAQTGSNASKLAAATIKILREPGLSALILHEFARANRLPRR